MRRGQGSVEYLIILAASIVIIMVIVGYIATFSHSMANETTSMNKKGVSSVMSKIQNVSRDEING